MNWLKAVIGATVAKGTNATHSLAVRCHDVLKQVCHVPPSMNDHPLTKCDLEVVLLAENARAPTVADNGDAGFDLYSAENVTLHGWACKKVRTGIALRIPKHCCGRLAVKLSQKDDECAIGSRLDVVSGAIGSSFHDEIVVCLVNLSGKTIEVKEGMKIAQIVFERICNPCLRVVPTFEKCDEKEKAI